MLHVFKHHDERVAIHTHAVEHHNVFVLQVGEKLSLPLKVFSGSQGWIFESLRDRKCFYCRRCKDKNKCIEGELDAAFLLKLSSSQGEMRRRLD